MLNSDIDNEERVTCVSCRFRYPSVRRFCPMCGLPAPADQATLDTGNQASGGGLAIEKKTGSALRVPLTTGFRKSITVVISTVLLLCSVYYLTLRSRSTENRPAASSVGPASSEPRTQGASAPLTGPEESPSEDGNSRSATTPPGPISKTEDDNPVELWNRVRHGSTEAEVALAKLYLQGITVERNCEQAHVLLLAASQKGSKAADSLLAGPYAQSCQ